MIISYKLKMDQKFFSQEIKTANPLSEIGCIIMASGHGRRFGQNKLVYTVNGKEIISYVLDAIPSELKEQAFVVTRYEKVKRIAMDKGFHVKMHELPDQSDTIKVGLSSYLDSLQQDNLKGCIFISGDQPMITETSILGLVHLFYTNNCSKICRLGYQKKQGAPVIFPASLFHELFALTGDNGGRSVVKKHLEDVVVLQASCNEELFDIDTPEDVEKCFISKNTEK